MKLRDINSPSQLFRRYLCPGSAREERPFYPDVIPSNTGEGEKPEKTNESAARGTLLHELTTALIQKDVEPDTYLVKGPVEEEDKAAVVWVANKVREIREKYKDRKPLELNEHELPLVNFGIPRNGTIDYGLVAAPWGVVIDFKYGFGYVPPPKWNWQFKCYAAGMAETFGLSEVEAIKIQPSLYEEDRCQSYLFTASELEEAGAAVRAIISATEAPNAPLVPGYVQCQWCRARETCRARQMVVASMPMHLPIRNYITNAAPVERGEFYSKLLVAQNWIERAIDTVHYLAIKEGMKLEGWQIGEGRKSRVWENESVALANLRSIALDKGISPDLFEKRSMVSVSEAEKILGKSKAMVEKMASMIKVLPGKECLIPEKGEKSGKV